MQLCSLDSLLAELHLLNEFLVDWLTAFSAKIQMDIICSDRAKALDVVCREGLLIKLERHMVTGLLL